MPDVYQFVKDEAIDMEKVASVQLALERHIKAREAISFLYRRSGKRYTVEPFKILYHGGFWYLVAMHDGIVKKFLLDFIEGIRSTGKTCREIPESVRKTLSDAQTIWFEDKEPDRVTVEFDADVAHFFERKGIFPRQKIVRKEKDGKIVVSFAVHNDMDFRDHIARWIPYFRVLEPARYRDFIRGVATQVATRNEGLPI
jgi:predicted DNA-binding transcriptional regulator YafY